MPGPNKSFEAFETDDVVCRNFADQTLGSGENSANNSQLGSAALGTLLGAGLGAAIGGGRGEAIGAGAGAVGGTVVGTSGTQHQEYSLQQRYNISYQQCMYSKGNQVPGAALPANSTSSYSSQTVTPAVQPPAGAVVTPTAPPPAPPR